LLLLPAATADSWFCWLQLAAAASSSWHQLHATMNPNSYTGHLETVEMENQNGQNENYLLSNAYLSKRSPIKQDH